MIDLLGIIVCILFGAFVGVEVMNSDPRAVKFGNEGVRPCSDLFASAYYAAKKLVASYDATGMVEILGDDPEFNNWLDDESSVDGRPPLSSGGAKLYVENARSVIAMFETPQQNGVSFIQGILSVSPRYH